MGSILFQSAGSVKLYTPTVIDNTHTRRYNTPMSTATATLNGSEIVTKGNYHTLAAKNLIPGEGLVLKGDRIIIGNDNATIEIDGEVKINGAEAVTDQQFDSTSKHAQSGVALNFLHSFTGTVAYPGFGADFANAQGVSYTFQVKRDDDGVVRLGYATTEGQTEKQSNAAFDSVLAVSNYGFVEETGNVDRLDPGRNDFIVDLIKAQLNNRTVNRLTAEEGAEVVAGARLLREDDILYLVSDGHQMDLSQVNCKENATAEIWIDIPGTIGADPEILWPSGASWVDTDAPSSLVSGYRYTFTIRNDGQSGTAVSHLCMNQAYAYELPTA